jgi:low affinity Fe/Cu permease
VRDFFRIFSQRVSEGAGSPWAFIAALSGVVVWAVLGPYFRFSNTWQLSMSTICSIIPTLMVFLIQNMQNRDSKAMQLKLDELIRATGEARNTLIQLESMSDVELETLETEFQRVRGNRKQALSPQGQAVQTTGSAASP